MGFLKLKNYFHFHPLFCVVFLLIGGTEAGILGTVFQRASTVLSGLGQNGFLASPPKEAFLNTPDLIRHHGQFSVETHKVTTEDGYILTLFRIPPANSLPASVSGIIQMTTMSPANETETIIRDPVLLWHGEHGSSDDWLLISPARDSLPYLLAARGHDVWLANTRGNAYSRGHVNKLRPVDPKFYDFSQDEIGRYDVPATIRHILKTTGMSQVSAVCHSMGCNFLSIALLERPELSEQIRKMTFLAPAHYMTNVKSPFFRVMFDVPGSTLQAISDFVAGGRMIPMELTDLMKTHGPHLCIGSFRREICANVINYFFGFDNAHATESTASLMMGHRPGDSSMKTMIHMGQMIRADSFQKFDYGILNNKRMYKMSKPPAYNLDQIRVPIQAFYGLADPMTVPKTRDTRRYVTNIIENVLKTLNELGACHEKRQVNHTEWTHLDFLYSRKAKFYVYDHVLKFLSE